MCEQNQIHSDSPDCACCADDGRENGGPTVRIAVVGCAGDIHRTIAALTDGRLERAAEMVEAGLDPHEAAERNDIPYDVLVATGVIDQEPMDFVVPVKYEVEGYVVVKAMTAADAIIAVGKSAPDGITLEKPEIVDGSACVCGDCEMVDVYSGLYRKNAFKHPAVKTGIASEAARSYMKTKNPEKEPGRENDGDAGGDSHDEDRDESEEGAK